MRAAISYSTLWVDRNGDVMKEVCVFFYNDPLEYSTLKLDGRVVQLTNDRVIELVNEKWTERCRKEPEGKGQYVPCLRRVPEEKDADVRVKYTDSKSLQWIAMCSNQSQLPCRWC